MQSVTLRVARKRNFSFNIWTYSSRFHSIFCVMHYVDDLAYAVNVHKGR